jgi:ureidoglycolate lyase
VIRLVPQPLTAAAFAPFGAVIEAAGADSFPINQGSTIRFHAHATADPGPEGRAILSIFRGTPRPVPLEVAGLERHPLGTQAFMPLDDAEWLIVVAAGERPTAADCAAFRAGGRQGVQYGRNVWHHPLLVLAPDHEFLVVDRDGPGDNLEEIAFATPAELVTGDGPG